MNRYSNKSKNMGFYHKLKKEAINKQYIIQSSFCKPQSNNSKIINECYNY
jgi:hypothetical protein